MSQVVTPRTAFVARIGRTQKTVPIEHVLFMSTGLKLVTVHYHDPVQDIRGEIHLNESLASLEKEFNGYFVRIHRYYMVPRHRLGKIVLDPTGEDRSKFLMHVHGLDKPLQTSRDYARKGRYVKSPVFTQEATQ